MAAIPAQGATDASVDAPHPIRVACAQGQRVVEASRPVLDRDGEPLAVASGAFDGAAGTRRRVLTAPPLSGGARLPLHPRRGRCDPRAAYRRRARILARVSRPAA
ncbi:MAG: hypothetical protein D6731_02800 [Planctomycetota bacterium]|nr:MAG: hypothetical protein D6731_02800 [Planctomycetota bacterium]